MSVQPYLGKKVNHASAEEMRQRGILDEDEVLLALFDGILLDENRRRIGGIALSDFIALTDRRLITWARGFFNDTVDSFAWPDVDVARAETWDPWHGRVAFAFRLPAVAPRTRRIMVKGTAADAPEGERVVVNTLDYMPADDVIPLSNMIGWTGDQAVAGLSGEALVAAFSEQFPAPDRQPLSPFFAPLPPEPPAPPPAPAEQPRRRWWQREAEEQAAASSGNLIADYESRRSAVPAGDGTPAVPTAGPLPAIPEQPSMYEVSRSLRLLLEAPRKLVRGVRRAGEMIGGAGELVNGLQDPLVRRNAMHGLYAAAAQQEAEGGPLAPVGPVVRAAVRFSEPLPSEEAESQGQARRIQVRAATRRSTPVQAEIPAQAAEQQPAAPVRRSISVRRVEPEAEADGPAPAASRAPVRRISISRNGEGAAPEQRAVPAGADDGE